jgi:hypothetical protein
LEISNFGQNACFRLIFGHFDDFQHLRVACFVITFEVVGLATICTQLGKEEVSGIFLDVFKFSQLFFCRKLDAPEYG